MEAISYISKNLLPGVILNKKTGVFEISGHSCPEDAGEFYEPIFNWLDEYKKQPLQSTTLDFKMTYFNTVTAKVFYLIMTRMEDLSFSGYDVKIRWFYNEGDEDLEEAGAEFEKILNVNFERIPVSNDFEEEDLESYFN